MRFRFRTNRTKRSTPFDYERTVELLKQLGLDEADIRFGSILEHHLDFIRRTVNDHLAGPLTGLHIGNFVGLSLAGFAEAIRKVDPDSTVVAIDPNVRTAGIDNPQQHVIRVLEEYDLLSSVVLVSSYSFEPTPLSGAPPVDSLPASGTNALPQLARLGVRFDVALIDGNHSGSTVSQELAWLRERMRPGGVVFLDAVTDAWVEIRDIFNSAADGQSGFTAIGHDGRIGALQRQTES